MLRSLRGGQSSCRYRQERQDKLGDSWSVPNPPEVAKPIGAAILDLGKIGVRAKFPGMLLLNLGEQAKFSIRARWPGNFCSDPLYSSPDPIDVLDASPF